jgi:hypothetical protein
VGTFTTSGTSRRARVNVEPNRRVESGAWNPVATTRTGTANARPSTAVLKRQRLLRSCLPFAARAVRHLLTDGMYALPGRKLPARLHAKLDTTQRNPEHAAYPAQMLKLPKTHEFPASAHIDPIEESTDMATGRPPGPPRRQRRALPANPPGTIRPRPRPHRATMSHPPTTCPHPRRAPNNPRPDRRVQSRRPAMRTPRCTSTPS